MAQRTCLLIAPVAKVRDKAVVRWVIPSPIARPNTEGTKASMTDDSASREHDVHRLQTAREHRDRRLHQYDEARGTPAELRAFAELQAALDQFAAREAWLAWGDRGY